MRFLPGLNLTFSKTYWKTPEFDKGYNDHLAQLTQGIYGSLGIEGMLSLKPRETAAA